MKRQAQIFHILTISALILNLLTGCENNEEDQQLKDQLLGTWKSTNSYYKSYTFKEDNTFIDTSFVLNDKSVLVPLDIIAGKYSIKDGLLTFYDIYLKSSKSIEQYTASYSFHYDPVYTINVQEDNLTINQKDIFESLSNSNSGIVGKWSHNRLFVVYSIFLENKYSGGTVNGIYDFKSDMSVNWQYNSPFDSNIIDSGNSTTTYQLTDSQLNINGWNIYNVTVSYTKNTMTWIYGNRTFQRN